jgi:cytochrome c peroxidase
VSARTRATRARGAAQAVACAVAGLAACAAACTAIRRGTGAEPGTPLPGGWLDAEVAARVARNPPLPPVPPDPTNRWADDESAARLGHLLFFDAGLSASDTVNCATCHAPAYGFSDRRALAVGTGVGTRHSMTVLNAAHQRWFTWDGRADTLWSQAMQPFESPAEMNTPRVQVLGHVMEDPELLEAWERTFGGPPRLGTPAEVDASFARLGKAIAAYERKLVTGASAYDRWWTRRAAGDPRADDELTDEERRGLALFFGKANCFQCHHGPNFSDGEFHMLGLPEVDGAPPRDPGRYAVIDRVRTDPMNAAGPHSDDPDGPVAQVSASLARSPERWGEFRTPSLRNVAETPPYMHAGQAATLEDVVRFYSTLDGAVALDHHRESVLVRLDLTARERRDLVAFLGALTGTPPELPWGDAPERRRQAGGPPARNPGG